MRYKEAGVDIDAGAEAVERMKKLVKATYGEEVLAGVGGFGALFKPKLQRYESPVLVASTDSVGTKLKVAFAMGKHDTVGQDLVNHCVNDILTTGARPLFFLDYISTSALKPKIAEEIVKGVAEACKEAQCALIGGETAELPGFYAEGEYDLVGSIVGIVDEKKIIDGSRIEPGDRLIGLPSNGLHTNGYSLARKVLFEKCGYSADARLDEIENTVGDELLRIHRSYAPILLPTLDKFDIKGLAHITGGGFTDNIPRILPEGCSVRIDLNSWDAPPIFALLQREGEVPEEEMFRTFNIGIGMVAIIEKGAADGVLGALKERGETGFIIGAVVKGERKVEFTRS